MTARSLRSSLLAALPAVASASRTGKLPFVYTKWKQFTVRKMACPNDHIFAVKADGNRASGSAPRTASP